MYKNGSVSFLPYGERAIYYRQMDGIENFDGFKDGFAMISGDSDRRTYDASDPAQEAISFTCLPGYTANSGSAVDSPGIPTQKCAGGIRGNVNFPSVSHLWRGSSAMSPALFLQGSLGGRA